MLDWIDQLLDRIAMYRLLLYYLIALVMAAAGLSILGYLHYNPLAILFSASWIVAVCWISNRVFAYAYGAPTNPESSLITGLILALIITPVRVNDPHGLLFLTAGGGLAIASKYMLAWNRKHIFNPAAIAVLLTSIGAGQAASWWVGTGPMLPFVLIGGLLLTRRIRHFQMVGTFIIVSYAVAAGFAFFGSGHVLTALRQVTLSSSLFFLGFVMLTEPQTSPTQAGKQRWYAALVGALFPPQVHLGALSSTPEIALTMGNIFSYIVSPKTKLFPELTKKIRHAPDIADFVFRPDSEFSYQPGQYMEWTLPHARADSRGDRRYFTLASSPTEPEVRIGVKFYEGSSSYKKALWRLDSDDVVVASQLSGDFVLPKDASRKLAFIAGGIGVTPYRSMLKYLLDTRQRRDVTMLYAASSPKEIVYKDVLESARGKLGANITYCVEQRITPELIKRRIPDYKERLFYVSGPQDLVAATQKILHELGVARRHIKTDYFPGYNS
jgi:ferredoxin-NADP reductase/Na+-transporting NADH:ubiquinone oxidoreductase subunit NqrB